MNTSFTSSGIRAGTGIKKRATGTLWIRLAAALFLVPPPASDAAERRMVFHELPTAPESAYVAYLTYPRISGNGQKIVSAYINPATNRYHFRAINFDGTGGHEIDVQRGGSDIGYFISALSADGSTYVRANFGVITVCPTAGSVGTEFLRLTNNSVGGLALSDDGTKLYVVVAYDDTVFGTGTVIQAGLWEFPVGGPLSARRAILSKTSVASALGIPIGDITQFTTEFELAASQNAQRLVCSFQMPFIGIWPTRVVAVNLDGSGIHQLGVTYDALNAIAISADGGKVALLHGYSGAAQATVMNFDGTGQVVVATGPDASHYPASLTANGSHLCLHGGWLHRTDGVSRENLFHTGNNIAQGNMREGAACIMSRDGRRFSYVDTPAGSARLNCLEIDPVSLGAAPDVTEPSATPPFVVFNNGTSTTLRVRATFPGTPNGVATKSFEDGAVDSALYSYNFGGDVNDTGTNGDVTAGDGYYTVSNFQCYDNDASAPGPKTLRFAAQSRDAGNLRHSTIIDFVPFSVLTSAPAGSAPTITSLNPTSGVAGSHVTINGSNFNSARNFNVVTMNGYNVPVVSANAGGTQLEIEVPGFFANGNYDVVVTANGQSSTAAVFTVGPPVLLPDIDLGQTSLAFGSVPNGTTSDMSVTVSNIGAGDLVITSVASSSPRFAHVLPALPLTIPAGQFSHVFVRFSPVTATVENGTLTITSNDPDEANVQVSLSGTGTGGAVPVLTTLAATGLSGTAPTLNGSVNANGTSVSVSFQYGLTTAYGSSVSAVPSSVTGASTTSVSAAVSGLAPNTVYHCRLVGVVGAVTYHGGDVAFATGSSNGATQFINFDNFTMGVQPANFLAAYGIPSVTSSGTGPGVGAPRINDHTFTNSTIPSSPNVLEQQALSNDPNQTHILTFNFSPALAAFSMDRVGKHSGGSTDTWHADFYNAAGTLLGSVGESSPVVNAPVQRFGFTAPAGQTIARMELVSVWTAFATHRNIPVDNFLLEPTLSPGGIWRRTCFDTSEKTGIAADDADPDHDGIVNFLEFSTLGNPNAASMTPGELVDVGGGVRQFVYYRSKAAMADGILFAVQWSDDLSPAGWSSAGVTEQVLFENAEYQEVWATFPQGSGHRFTRLWVGR